jgi:hypothetical protein
LMARLDYCRRCLHFSGFADPANGRVRALTVPPTCAAFLDGIPESIQAVHREHDSEYPGDRGIRFAPAKGRTRKE